MDNGGGVRLGAVRSGMACKDGIEGSSSLSLLTVGCILSL